MYLAIVFVSFFVFDDFDTYFTLSPVLNLVSANREIIHHSVIKIRKKSLYQSFLNSSLMQSYLFPIQQFLRNVLKKLALSKVGF